MQREFALPDAQALMGRSPCAMLLWQHLDARPARAAPPVSGQMAPLLYAGRPPLCAAPLSMAGVSADRYKLKRSAATISRKP